MRNSDPLAGFRAASGDPVIHMTFFISILILDKQDSDKCQLRSYSTALTLLLVAHIVNTPIIFISMGRMCCKCKTEIFEKSMKFVALMLYCFGIFYAQDVLLFDNLGEGELSQCTLIEGHRVEIPQLWLTIEVIQFYQGFLTATIFACLAKICRKEKDYYIMTGEQPEGDEADLDLFIEATFTFDMFSQYLNPLFLTLLVLYYSINFEEIGTGEYNWILWTMVGFHTLQVVFATFFIYGYKLVMQKKENIGLWGLCCCICCSPLILLICQIIAMASLEQANDPLSFIWVLNDTLITTLSMMIFIYRTYENDKIKKKMTADQEALEEEQNKLDLNASTKEKTPEENETVTLVDDDCKQIDIEVDYYSLAYVSFIKLYQVKHSITRNDLANIMYNVCFVFFMQMILVFLIGYEFEGPMVKVKIQVAITRFVCAYLLHFAMEPEFRQSITLFKFFIDHSNKLQLPEPTKPQEPNSDLVSEERASEMKVEHKKALKQYDIEYGQFMRASSLQFSHRIPPLVICLMQMIACNATEIMNILVICTSTTVMNVVMDYIALEIIAQIDNLYAETIQSRIAKEIPEEDDWQPFTIWSRKKNLPASKRRCWNIILYTIFKMIKLFYASFYYYFYPLIVIILTYFAPGTQNCELLDFGEDGACLSERATEILFEWCQLPNRPEMDLSQACELLQNAS